VNFGQYEESCRRVEDGRTARRDTLSRRLLSDLVSAMEPIDGCEVVRLAELRSRMREWLGDGDMCPMSGDEVISRMIGFVEAKRDVFEYSTGRRDDVKR
jgi:hypothetical protein